MNTFFTARLAPLPFTLKSCEGEGANSAVDSVTDEALLALLQAGEQDALGRLFQRYARIVRSVAARILRDVSEADDLVQDLFLFIQRKCANFDGSKSSARSWIIQMAYHRAIERRRHLTTRQFYAQTEIESNTVHMVGTPTVESDYCAERVFGRNGLTKVLKSLSEDQRETLRLHFFDGYTFSEISQKVGQPLENVRHHYYRGLDKLRRQMFANTVPVSQGNGKWGKSAERAKGGRKWDHMTGSSNSAPFPPQAN